MRRIAARATLLAGLALALAAGCAYGAYVFADGILVKAEGTFTPSVLPLHAYKPITLQGHINISIPSHGVPPAVASFNVDFGHDGRLQTQGLPVCQPEKLADTTPGQARKICKNAIVATGNVEALIHQPGEPQVPVRAPLTAFNGPPEGGNPTVVFHSYNWFPKSETYVVTAPIVRSKGRRLAFHIDAEVPPIAEGYGSITHVDLKVGKTYRYKGRELSYTSAHCPDGVLEAHGRITFVTGTVIAGSLYRPCSAE